ncbi:hypothetical protein EMPS_02283 [Entomortierella parvispora]|uniref:Tag1-like fifth Ig-like domain-containing protein n=1 Tax=Entomortierella parvispora TaxID=205924 RepID=A0A9P3H4K8_9FUNG|nr:hypothetical protein EMPS_02283 [Entomortierella parvispora]
MDIRQETRQGAQPHHNGIPRESNGQNSDHTEQTPLLANSSSGTTASPNRYSDDATVAEAGARKSTTATLERTVGGRLLHCGKKHSRFVKAIGALLVLCLLAVLLSPWAAQRVLDRAMVLEIQQTEIYDMDQTGFQIHLLSSVHLDSSRDGFMGLTKILEVLVKPTLTIKPTILTLAVPNEEGGRKDRKRRKDVDSEYDMAEFKVERQQLQMGESLQLNISTHVAVTDSALMAEFFGETLDRSTVDLVVRGNILTRLGPLWYVKLRINRLVALEGLRGVQDATLVSMALPDNHPQGGIIMSGVARINNPSKEVSLRMGPVSFGIFIPTKAHPETDFYKIAEMDCQGLQLLAGQVNEVMLSGRLLHLDDWALSEMSLLSDSQGFDKGAGSEKQLLLGELLSTFIRGENSTIQVRALAKDPKLPPWLAEVFKTIVLSMTFPGSPNKDDFIRAIGMDDLQFGFTDDSKSALLTGRLSTELALPPNVTFPIKLLKMKPVVTLRPSKDGVDMASLDVLDFLPTVSQQEGTSLKVDLELKQKTVRVLPGRLAEFNAFLNRSFTEESIEIGIAGDALAVVETGLGTFELGPISFAVATKQKGLGGLISEPPALLGLDVIDSTNHSLTIKATLVLWNPSHISASLGDVSFLWSHTGFVVGMATVPNLNLVAGNNTIECFGMMNPALHCKRKGPSDPECDPEEARNASRAFISKYISGDNSTTIEVLGYPGSTHIPLLQPMLSEFTISSHLPVIDQDFLISATMYLLSSTLVLELKNPLDTEITVLYVNGTASYKDERLGHILVDFEHDIASPKPILIPANDHQDENSGYVKTPRLPVAFDISSVGYEALKKALGGSLEVDVICHIKTRVGNMEMWVDFVKDGVQAEVRKGF